MPKCSKSKPKSKKATPAIDLTAQPVTTGKEAEDGGAPHDCMSLLEVPFHSSGWELAMPMLSRCARRLQSEIALWRADSFPPGPSPSHGNRDFIFQLDENFPSDVASAYNLSHYHAGQPGAAYSGRGALLHREAEVVCSHSLGVR